MPGLPLAVPEGPVWTVLRVWVVGSEPLLERGADPSGTLSRLSPVHIELLVLAYFRGLTQREISERTNMPLGTVKRRTTVALRETMGIDEDRWSVDE